MRALIALGLLLVAWPATAHERAADGPAAPWTWDPWITVPLVLSLLLYLIGWNRLRRRARFGPSPRSAIWFLFGWTILAAALVSPLHAAGERSFAAHMLEHELLMLAAAPLLALSRPLAILLWGLPSPLRQSLGGVGSSGGWRALWDKLTDPAVATALQVAALWGWHIPGAFDLALSSTGWHIAQHASFLGTALLFWTAMLRRGAAGVAALCLFLTSIVSGALGALMAFSQSPWYEGYARLGMAPFGLSPVEDQQLAGLLMWVPGGLVHGLAALLMVGTLLTPNRKEARHGAS